MKDRQREFLHSKYPELFIAFKEEDELTTFIQRVEQIPCGTLNFLHCFCKLWKEGKWGNEEIEEILKEIIQAFGTKCPLFIYVDIFIWRSKFAL